MRFPLSNTTSLPRLRLPLPNYLVLIRIWDLPLPTRVSSPPSVVVYARFFSLRTIVEFAVQLKKAITWRHTDKALSHRSTSDAEKMTKQKSEDTQRSKEDENARRHSQRDRHKSTLHPDRNRYYWDKVLSIGALDFWRKRQMEVGSRFQRRRKIIRGQISLDENITTRII